MISGEAGKLGKVLRQRVQLAYRVFNIYLGVLLGNVFQSAADGIHVLIRQRMVLLVRKLGGHGLDGACLDIGRGRVIGVGQDTLWQGSRGGEESGPEGDSCGDEVGRDGGR